MSRQNTAERPKKKLKRAGVRKGKPAWKIATLFPSQGFWSEADFFALEDACEGRTRLELVDGCVEVLPMATELHQLILLFFMDLLRAHTAQHAPGLVLPSGLFVRLATAKIRQPDVVYIKQENYGRRSNAYWSGADLVMEVVSGGHEDRKRDLEHKPEDYAGAAIPEYWIVDPKKKRVTVLVLDGSQYRVHGEFGPGTQATSLLLPGFAVSVDEILSPPGLLK